MPEFNPKERIGVNATERIILKDFHWIFREQPISDMGIDAHIEIVDNGKPTGKLISLQIKTGASHFTIDDEKLTYYGKQRHLDYYINHSLPVVLIAHITETDETYWAVITSKNITVTKKAWKIEIPKSQKFNISFINEIAKLGNGSDEEINRRKLIIDKPLMEAIKNGDKVSFSFMKWLHKSLNRTSIEIIITTNGQESTAKKWQIIYAGYTENEIFKLIFPWAKISIDEEFYRNFIDEQSLKRMYKIDWLYSQEFYPYRVQFGEAADYRLQLKLNDLGHSFLTYIDFIENGKIF